MSVDSDGPVGMFADRLRRTGQRVPSVDDRAGLDRVRSIRRRQRRRSRAAVALAAASVVVVGAVGLNIATGGDATDELIVTATPPAPTVEEPGVEPSTSVTDTDEAPTSVAETATTAVVVDDGEPPVQRVLDPIVVETFGGAPIDVSGGVPTLSFESPPGVPAGFEVELIWEFLVEWNDGFLLGRSVQVPPDGVVLDPAEASELLGGELLDVLFADETAVSANAADILRGAGFGDAVDGLLGEHPDVFEAFYSFEWPFGLETHFSADGETWEPFDIELPFAMGRPVEVASTGDRLAILTMPWRNVLPLLEAPTVWSTTDLVEWSSQEIPVLDPFADASVETRQYVNAYVQAEQLVAGDAGWGVETKTFFNIEAGVLAEERTERSISGYGVRVADGQVRIDINEIGRVDEEIVINLADLGFTPEHATLLERNDVLEVWTGGWEQATASPLADFSLYFYGGVAAFDDGLAAWTATAVGVVDPTTGSTRSFRIADDRYSVSTVVGLDDRLVVYANDTNGVAAVYELDPQTSTWTPLDIGELPPKMTVGSDSAGSILRLISRTAPPTVPTRSTFDQGDFRYTSITDPPSASYEVTRISTGEVLVSESVDIREAGYSANQQFEFRTTTSGYTNITVINPTTGEPLMEMDSDDLQVLWESLTQLDGSPMPERGLDDFEPRDTWLMVLSAGGWLLRDLEEPPLNEDGTRRQPYQPVTARSGDLVLVQTANGWQLYDLAGSGESG